ncbi:hypothetical protein [Dokdonella sp.]|uniref:hypothetical protein n=1 Tax=Dokdonella sp. TaxID=2291710 RepID=UPI003C6AB6AB
MNLLRFVLILSATTVLIACNRSQPPGVPESMGGSPVAEPAAKPVDPAPQQAPVRDLKPPPALNAEIPPYAKTGFPDCDDYVEEYRQCLNTRLAGDERKAAAHELSSSVIAITGNISRGVEPSRIASRCKKSRRLAAAKLERYGCLAPPQ